LAGNIRELENFIERSVILSKSTRLSPPLGELLKESARPISSFEGTLHDGNGITSSKSCARPERIVGSAGAAIRLGLKRTTLQYKMQRLGISRADFLP